MEVRKQIVISTLPVTLFSYIKHRLGITPYVYLVAICVIHSLINVQRLELRLGPALHVSELVS